MSRILLTGGAGLIGSFVAKRLIKVGQEVVIFDSFTNYISPLVTKYQRYLEERFNGIKDSVVILRGDTTNENNVRRALVKHKPQKIIHLAALPIADLSDTYSEEAVNTILHGTINILEVIRDVDFVERFVYISSSMIYGDFQYSPADEEHPKNPKDIYGGTKLAGEILTQSFSRRFGIQYTIVRPSAVYGPTDVNRRVSQIFVENALKGQELILYNGGTTKLDFTYVEDTAEGIVLATLCENARNEVFNITRGEGRSLKEFTEILRRWFPDLKTVNRPIKVIRPERGALDISKAKNLLGYEPKYSLEEGLEKYIDFIRRFFKK